MKKETLKRTITDRKSPLYGKTFSIEKELFLEIAERKEGKKDHEKKNS